MDDGFKRKLADRKENARSRIAACRIHAEDLFKSAFLYNEDAARSAKDTLSAIFKELDDLDARITSIELNCKTGCPLKPNDSAYKAARGR